MRYVLGETSSLRSFGKSSQVAHREAQSQSIDHVFQACCLRGNDGTHQCVYPMAIVATKVCAGTVEQLEHVVTL